MNSVITPAMVAANAARDFTALLRRHREERKYSQLELACLADVSQRHVSYLETGRSRPSRQMVLTLASAMDLGLREQNSLLQAAGFSPQYAARPLGHPDLTEINAALSRLLEHHMPYPAVVVDRLWNLRRANAAMQALISLAGDPETLWAQSCPDGSRNLARLTVHPLGIRASILNAREAIPLFLQRIRREAQAAASLEALAFVDELYALAGPDYSQPLAAGSRHDLLPTLPITLGANGVELSLFSMITTFGTPQDVTTDELRIELFYPADAATRERFDAQANRQPELQDPV